MDNACLAPAKASSFTVLARLQLPETKPNREEIPGVSLNIAARSNAIFKAVDGIGTDNAALKVNLWGLDRAGMEQLLVRYKEDHGHSLPKRIKSELQFDLDSILGDGNPSDTIFALANTRRFDFLHRQTAKDPSRQDLLNSLVRASNAFEQALYYFEDCLQTSSGNVSYDDLSKRCKLNPTAEIDAARVLVTKLLKTNLPEDERRRFIQLGTELGVAREIAADPKRYIIDVWSGLTLTRADRASRVRIEESLRMHVADLSKEDARASEHRAVPR